MTGPADFNPFVGLRPFEREDSLCYFGREEQVQSLLERLADNPFLAVVGSSGCGKSSLIRAGLIPALEGGFLVQDRDRWRIATLKPGQAPVRHLAQALLEAVGAPFDPAEADTLAAQLYEEGVDAALERLEAGEPAAGSNLLLLVDQFEELFRFGLGREHPVARDQAETFVALLQALHAQRQEIGAKPALRLAVRNRLGQGTLERAFVQRWASPSLRLKNSVTNLAFSPDGRVLASASSDNTVRLWDLRTVSLLHNGPVPSSRAALVSEALQRLWGLRVDGLDIVPETWDGLFPRDGYYVDQEITIAVRPAPGTTDTSAGPETRTFNIRPLLDPPKPGEDKLDQLLRWVKDQGM